MSDATFYNCPLKTHDWLKIKKKSVVFVLEQWTKGSYAKMTEVGLVTSGLLRCNDIQFIDMSAYFLSNLIMEKCFIWSIMWYPNRMNVKADV